jgi:hypothetical protein
MPELESLLERLIRQQVEFVVVGGFAAVAHGVTLLTLDIDVCCRFSPENLLKIQAAIADLHPVHRMTPDRIPLRLTTANCVELQNLYLDTDYGQLDCLGIVLGIGDYDEVEEQSVKINLPGGECRILGIDGLIQAKKAMGRARDKQTILQLKAIKERMK